MSSSRQLAVIMFTDIVGYTALMGNDEQNAFTILYKNRTLQRPVIEQFNGKWIKELGDGVLASFNTVSDAVNAAKKIQEDCKVANDFQLRIGIHLGEVVFEDDDVFGDGVNIASRIQAVAAPGSIYVSESIHLNVANKKDINTRFVKEEILKNVKQPMRIYEVILLNNYSPTSEIISNTSMANSIAVLAFTNMSSDPEQEYFSDGISEEIINTLAQIPNLKVTGRTSSFTFKGKNEDLRTIGEKLNVKSLLEGSVRSFGNRIRITAQLIDVQNGFHLWSEKYDRVLNDVFEVQDEIAKAIVEKLKITFGGKIVEAKSREQTQNVEAYQLYLKGRALVYKRGKFIFEAITLFEKALTLDREYALAYAGLADAYAIICYYGLLNPVDIWPKAIDNASKAMYFGPDLAESWNCNAVISLTHDWNWDKAKQQFLKALELNPGYEQARIWYGLYYLQYVCVDHEEATLNLRLALETHPLSHYANSTMAISLLVAGHVAESIVKAKKGVELEPDAYFDLGVLALAYQANKEYEKAESQLEKALSNSNRHSWALSMRAVVYAEWNKPGKALEDYEELLQKSKQIYIQPTVLAIVAAAIGHNEEALKFAHQACDEHDPFLVFACKCFPNSKALRQIAGFDEILKRMNLFD
jgi:adenylate cyclase